MEEKIPVLDQALSALFSDLSAKGLLDETLVVVATEFGPQRLVIVGLAVVDQNEVSENHGLVTGRGQIDDGQS